MKHDRPNQSGLARPPPPLDAAASDHHHHQSRTTADLVRDLVVRISNPSRPSDIERILRYASRMLSSGITPSISPDESAMAESIKRSLVRSGRSSDALSFADLLSKLSSSGGLRNRWALLYLLKSISDDHASSADTPPLLPISAASGGLPAINGLKTLDPRSDGGGVLMVSKYSEREVDLRDFEDSARQEAELERLLVRDVLHACQGIDGRLIKFDAALDGYALVDPSKFPRDRRIMVFKLCELGWLFRKVRHYVSSIAGFPDAIGTVGQAFRGALNGELSDYYKLLTVLDAQSRSPIPPSEGSDGGDYLSLRRLAVWLAEPTVRMRLMAALVDCCGAMKGGAMAGAIHAHASRGDPLVIDFMSRLLRVSCSPLYEAVRAWVLEGELRDPFGEFFVVSTASAGSLLWREGYRLQPSMLPPFIPRDLAHRILRTGKSINFLRACCDDQDGYTVTASEDVSIGYGETAALEKLVSEASERIDRRVLDVMYGRYQFKDHCLAIKRYLLLGQGDFVQYLMDVVGPRLSEPAGKISSFELSGLLETAVRASNAQYDDRDMLDRLKVKMMKHDEGDRGWDVFSLEYDACAPLDTVFSASAMERYLKVFNFLWKLRRVEHSLTAVWKTMKPNRIVSHQFTKQDGDLRTRFTSVSRRCQVLWDEMNHFVTNLQYYIMFEVLEVSWSRFLDEMETAKDLDDLLSAHDKYLDSIVEKSLLGERSKGIRRSLLVLFELVLRFGSVADRLFEGIYELQQRGRTKSSRLKRLVDDGAGGGGRKELMRRGGEFLSKMGAELDLIANEYSPSLDGFISLLPLQPHVDLKFLLFRLDFTEYYDRLHPRT
ncbi:hypothetical protein QJS10_CPA06g02256 [Acorus calamus]|uniref:Gamma-tubulin complex component n=1 Tax=Acorus calamus TaxID=4465 RepID=A0AAV9ELF3_ACOCL|nr:hypothetical protein QJS10_CPA06g02256 [Acorus calamus]